MTKRNPKQEGSNLFDCIPQVGPCRNQCNQCFYNRPGAFYVPIDQPSIPTSEEVGDGICRINCGNDSNLQRDLVIETAKQYKHFFFNTSIPKFDFPGPVVFTANPKEEKPVFMFGETKIPENMMFIRLRVSPTNLLHIEHAIRNITTLGVNCVLTYMAYYDQLPPGTIKPPKQENVRKNLEDWDKNICILSDRKDFGRIAYTWKVRHINSYWCPTSEYMRYVLKRMKNIGGRLVTMCGTPESGYCKDCGNCENYYWQTKKHLEEI